MTDYLNLPNAEHQSRIADALEEMAHIDNLEFEEVDYDQDVINRLNEVKDYPESEAKTVNEYVFNNKVVEGSNLALRKRNELLEESILQLSSLLVGGM